MKILLVGATGAIGRQLIPLFVASGHAVIGTTRVAEKGQMIQQLGATQVQHGELTADEGVTSFLHVADAAHATLLALQGPQGIFNIVDDEPAAATTWLPLYADILGAPAPAIGMGRPRGARGATNHKARAILRWQPVYPSWRTGFFQSLNR